jgi:hypothetical protein
MWMKPEGTHMWMVIPVHPVDVGSLFLNSSDSICGWNRDNLSTGLSTKKAENEKIHILEESPTSVHIWG